MTQRILLVALCVSIITTQAFAQDDLLEKIKLLEQQIQELKVLKEQQNISIAKAEQCMKVVAREKFCTCVGNSLPHDISFEHYVHTLIMSNEALGYAGMTQEQKAVIEATREVREKCIEKGFFK
jgi:GTPase Era involved in 16S rRNA processing